MKFSEMFPLLDWDTVHGEMFGEVEGVEVEGVLTGTMPSEHSGHPFIFMPASGGARVLVEDPSGEREEVILIAAPIKLWPHAGVCVASGGLVRGGRAVEEWKDILHWWAQEYARKWKLEYTVAFHGNAEIRFFNRGPRPVIAHPADGEEDGWEECFPALTITVNE